MPSGRQSGVVKRWFRSPHGVDRGRARLSSGVAHRPCGLAEVSDQHSDPHALVDRSAPPSSSTIRSWSTSTISSVAAGTSRITPLPPCPSRSISTFRSKTSQNRWAATRSRRRPRRSEALGRRGRFRLRDRGVRLEPDQTETPPTHASVDSMRVPNYESFFADGSPPFGDCGHRRGPGRCGAAARALQPPNARIAGTSWSCARVMSSRSRTGRHVC